MRTAIATVVLVCITNFIWAQKSKTTGWNYNEPISEDTIKIIKGKSIPKSVIKKMGGLKFIEGGIFTMGRTTELNFTKDDSTLYANTNLRRITVSNFFISDHEVTNKEYREFVTWVRDSIARTLLSKNYDDYFLFNEGVLNWDTPIKWGDSCLLPLFLTANERFYKLKAIDTRKLIYVDSYGKSTAIYPDTNCWTNDFKYSYNEPMEKLYFNHSAYNDYPVVGVNYLQATAYCNWKTAQINNLLLSRKNNNLLPNFRLPTEAEWEYAAIGNEVSFDKYASRTLFPWSIVHFVDAKGKYLANFGQIIDANGIHIKYFGDDGGLQTVKTKSYPSNGFNLYDMAGNVSEWVLDAARLVRPYDMDYYSPFRSPFFRNYFKPKINYMDGENDSDTAKIITNEYNRLDSGMLIWNHSAAYFINENDDVNSAMIKLYLENQRYNNAERIDTNDFYDKAKLLKKAENYLHDFKMINSGKNAYIIKGGSWADGPAYLIAGSRCAFPEKKSSCKLGFRIAMTYIPGMPKNMINSNKVNLQTNKEKYY